MALASYFGRTATAASQVLQRFDARAFERLLNGLVVGIAFDGQACSTEGRASLDLLVRLLARLYPSICFLPEGEEAGRLAKALARLARSINSRITLARRGASISHCVVVGSAIPEISCPTLYLGSNGWLAKFSVSQPVGSGDSHNPFGAGAAACIAAANLFRLVFIAQLNGASIDETVAFSVFDYAPGSQANPALSGAVDLDRLFLLGLGAIGNGAVWGLSRVPGLRGTLELVDPETIDQGNLQRYVLALERDVGRSKVKLARGYLKNNSGLSVVGHEMRWQALTTGEMQHVAVALDSAEDRIALQGALPRWTMNSWTQRGDLGVSHHGFDDDMACLACLYLPNGTVPDQDDVIAAALGLEDLKLEVVRPMLHNGSPVDLPLMAEISSRLAIPIEPLLPFVGKPLRALYQEAICGGVVFEVTGGRSPVKVEVPMAFQSVMAGIMLAGEIIKRAGSNGGSAWTTAKLNLLRKMPSDVITERRKKDPQGRCICQDADYLAAYRVKYGPVVVSSR
ncbi:E2 ligase fold family C protein [Mesorhizobium atlanticum]|uniref:THIF-type NAD/FAD binding fold domain-containing protein n=1 Tax=Mesorhizobium atlanticum TaxID=2233532 RepID=A0A330GKJ3_9HYPH|nr:E2 ligase fold family C protein [Mesorhizobium atlanticum]RAZ73037.1 hypothetical protein DPM35_27120 [Mesorhizobium atlanticum]